MAAKILSHPALNFERMLGGARSGNVGDVISLFRYALENGLSRTPVAKLAAQVRGKQELSTVTIEESEEFIRWCNSKQFVLDGKSENAYSSKPRDQAQSGDDGLDPSSNKERERFFEEVRQLGKEIGEGHDELAIHKYWYFRPGHEVDAALWKKIFDNDDPILPIVWHLKSFFKNASKTVLPRQEIKLTSNDILVFRVIFEYAAQVFGQESVSLRGSIITAAGLENVVEGALTWTSERFALELVSSPNWLRELLVAYWANRANINLDGASEDVVKVVRTQVVAISSILLTYCGQPSDSKVDIQFDVNYLSDEIICNCVSLMDSIYIETNADDELQPYVSATMCALYDSRDAVFGGVFPFRFEKANELLCYLPNEDRYWLHTIFHYVPEHYNADWEFDEFSLVNALPRADEQHRDLRTNSRPRSRYRSYRNVYEICLKDGRSELAVAWWAFFVATQAIGFPAFGLTSAEVGEVCDACVGMMSEPAMLKAVRLALSLERDRPESLGSRNSIWRLTALLNYGRKNSRSDLISIVSTKDEAESFLRSELGRETWEALHEETKADLVEAEQRLSRAWREFGGLRRDWGSFCLDYARAIEREVRLHVGPLVARLKEAGAFPAGIDSDQGSRKTLELGYYVHRIGDANELLKKRNPIMSETDAGSIQRLHGVFTDNNFKNIVAIRNKAAHGNELNADSGRSRPQFRDDCAPL